MPNYNYFGEPDEIDLTGTLRKILPKGGEWSSLRAEVRVDEGGMVEYRDVKVTSVKLADDFTVSINPQALTPTGE